MTKQEIQSSLDTYFQSIEGTLKNINNGNKDTLFQIVYNIYHPLEKREHLSSVHVFMIFSQVLELLEKNLEIEYETQSVKICGNRWESVKSKKTGKSMPIMIDGIYDTTPSMIAGKIIFFILMETL